MVNEIFNYKDYWCVIHSTFNYRHLGEYSFSITYNNITIFRGYSDDINLSGYLINWIKSIIREQKLKELGI